jgi:hypothetical protein
MMSFKSHIRNPSFEEKEMTKPNGILVLLS